VPPARTLALTAAAMAGFAANSLLCRAALRGGAIDPASFTLIRLASGAAVLAVLARRGDRERPLRASSWAAAFALFAYALAFSLAYLRLDVGAGALILFGTVQATMLAAGFRAGERWSLAQALGLALALAGLVVLTGPGTSAPDPLGAALMASAGLAWGAYSLLGRGCAHPLAATAGNFARSVPMALLAGGAAVWVWGADLSARGVALAVASGTLASGLGYSLWYAALPSLTATGAACVQLSVPVLAALGGAALLGEVPSARTTGAGAAILAGIALVIFRRRAGEPGRRTRASALRR
jgi:drug/metabolite transporter (DMT)-like permease